MLPHKLFNRLFGTKDADWMDRKHSILMQCVKMPALKSRLGRHDQARVEDTSARSEIRERAISLPPEYMQLKSPLRAEI
jgi:hypothetical protein